MAKNNISFTKIEAIVKDWKEKNKLKGNERYTLESLTNLDVLLCGEMSETLPPRGPGGKELTYYSYHLVWRVLRDLDPTLSFKHQMVDWNNYELPADICNRIKGLSVNIFYTSEKLPLQNQEITLAITDNRFNAIMNPSADEVEYAIGRGFVKTIAFNTNFGHIHWAKAGCDFVLKQIAKANDLPAQVKTQEGSGTIPKPLTSKTIGANGMVSNLTQTTKPPSVTTPPGVIPTPTVLNPTPVALAPTPVVSAPVVNLAPPQGLNINLTPPVSTPVAPTAQQPQANKGNFNIKNEFLSKCSTNPTLGAKVMEFFKAKGQLMNFNNLSDDDMIALMEGN